MPANTVNGLPYPLGTDRVMDGDDAIKNLAQAIRIASGSFTIASVAAPPATASQAIAFPAGLFSAVPMIFATIQGGAPANYQPPLVNPGATTTAATINIARAPSQGAGSNVTVFWLAVQFPTA